MNGDFPRIVTLLRKERGLSQKQAALELGISQALLSHYEKGIRECGLDFVVRIADYYNVSCDYLLGRTPDRSGATLNIADIPLDEEPQPVSDHDSSKAAAAGAMAVLNKKLIVNSINVVYGILEQTESQKLTSDVSSYLMTSVYKMLRTVYAVNPRNPEAMFSVMPDVYAGLSSALQCLSESSAKQTASGKLSSGTDEISNPPVLSPDVISRQYPDLAPSLYNLIQKTEEKMKKLN